MSKPLPPDSPLNQYRCTVCGASAVTLPDVQERLGPQVKAYFCCFVHKRLLCRTHALELRTGPKGEVDDSWFVAAIDCGLDEYGWLDHFASDEQIHAGLRVLIRESA